MPTPPPPEKPRDRFEVYRNGLSADGKAGLDENRNATLNPTATT